MMRRFLICGAASVTVASAAGGQKDVETPENWAYANDAERSGTQEWNSIAKDCGQVGSESPIDITGGKAQKESKLSLANDPTCDAAFDFVMNPHTNQVNIPKACQKKFVVTYGGKEFQLLQFHFHSPSEHTVDGQYFPMETHYVHSNADGQLLIVSSMVGVGGDAAEDKFLRSIFDKMPTMEGVKGDVHTVTAEYPKMDPYSFVAKDFTKTYYEYLGSLTTPPCTGGELWIIAGSSVSISQSTLNRYRKGINANPGNQLALWKNIHKGQTSPAFNSAAGSITWDSKLKCNSRPIQKLHGKDGKTREILYTGSPTLGKSGHTLLYIIIGVVGCLALLLFVFRKKFSKAPEEEVYTNAREMSYNQLLAA